MKNQKKKINIPPWYWFVSFGFAVIAFLLGVAISNIDYLNERGTEIFGKKFSTFEISGWKNFENEYWYPSNTPAGVISVSNNWDVALAPSFEKNLDPDDNEIKIDCKNQINGKDCSEGLIIDEGDLVPLEFNVEVGNPSQKNYKFCIKIIDTRENRENNFKSLCKDLTFKKKPK